MKLCWWTVYPTPNQTAIVMALRRRGVDVVVCYFGRYDEYRASIGWKPPVLNDWEFEVGDITSAQKAIPDFDKRIQMVPSFADRMSWSLIRHCVKRHVPWFVVTERSSGSWKTWLLRKVFAYFANRWALRVFCIGKAAERQFARLGVRPSKIRPFVYAVPPPDGGEVGVKDGRQGCQFVYAGALSRRKAVDVLAAAWKIVQHQVPSARLRVIGDGALRNVIEGLPGVEMVGAVRQEEVYAKMAGGDVVILPSRYDAWGISLCEGAWCGMAMVASDRVGAAELIEEGKSGTVVRAGSVEALVRGLMMYAEEPGRAAEHGRAARLTMEQHRPDVLADCMVKALSERIVPDFWEEHCTECAEPLCYATCPKFERAPFGRCRRFARGIERLDDNGGMAIAFRPWGKLELLFHGRMATPETVSALRKWNAAKEPLAVKLASWCPHMIPYWRNPYGLFRSWRWRKVVRKAECAGRPEVWKGTVVAEKPERLAFEVRDREGQVLFSRIVEVGPARRTFAFPLPRTGDGCLFSIHPADGEGTGRIELRQMELSAVAASAPHVKCVAWDLDGVLWSGTLSEGSRGEVNQHVVNVIRELDARGILNSICSKNDAEQTLAELRGLGLEEYFVFPQISWGAKSLSLQRLAEELNIGLDTLAFVDDRQENRAEVRELLPQVRVFDETQVEELARMSCFNPPLSAESPLRRVSYRAEMRRREAERACEGGRETFLVSSGLDFELLPVEGERVARCRELVQRTNQLNLTGRRYSEAEFQALLATAACHAIRVWDRYGDYGIVGFLACRDRHLVECCFSCRVACRGVERKVLSRVSGGKKLTADIVVTDRNGPIREIVKEFTI